MVNVADFELECFNLTNNIIEHFTCDQIEFDESQEAQARDDIDFAWDKIEDQVDEELVGNKYYIKLCDVMVRFNLL